jgi:sugar/nucleoside kinase (ribokinase family)
MPRFDVTIAGELNLDLILYNVPEELPRERELLASDLMLTLGGSSAIAAHNLAALGCAVGFQSKIGEDQLGDLSLERLAAGGVDVTHVRRVSTSKTGLTVVLQREAWRNMVTYSGTISELTLSDLDLGYLSDAKHFHYCSYYLQGAMQKHVANLFRKLKDKGLTISLDTNDDPDDRWQNGLSEVLPLVDVFMPNEREACRITGITDLSAAVARLAEIVPLVVVKCGTRGAMAQRGKERFTSPAMMVNAVDAVGAGDSFNAGFLSRYVRGAHLPECLAAGNLAGAFSTTCAGGTEAFRDRAAMARFFDERGH